jgi:hypothetical protein
MYVEENANVAVLRLGSLVGYASFDVGRARLLHSAVVLHMA